MNSEISFKTAVCTEYERLLTACQYALESWRSRREEIARSRLHGKQAGNELLRLQANYAKAYAQLEQHKENCETCSFVSKIGRRDFAAVANSVLDRKRFA